MKSLYSIPYCIVLFLGFAVSAHSQGGPLTPPPGVPGPTMKSLEQIEPRIPVVTGAPGVAIDAFGGVTLSQPGSYYLTGNVNYTGSSDGIRITSSGVTLDMMGCSVVFAGAGNADDAIEITGRDVVVQNGRIRSTTTYNGINFSAGGFGWGVFSGSLYGQVRVSGMVVTGTRTAGISLGMADGNTIENSSVADCAGTAFYAGTISSCSAQGVLIGAKAQNVRRCDITAEGVAIEAKAVENSSATSAVSSAIVLSGIRPVCRQSQGTTTSTHLSSLGINGGSGTVIESSGSSQGGHGILAEVVISSTGVTSGANGADSCGIRAIRMVTSSSGHAENILGGDGIHTEFASQCRGWRGSAIAGWYGLRATQANGCHVTQNVLVTQKFDMP